MINEIFNMIDEIFNNTTVGAFFGAFFAFLLVILTDFRRERRKRKLLDSLLKVNHAKKETLTTHISNVVIISEEES